jgi:hypothetical protein
VIIANSVEIIETPSIAGIEIIRDNSPAIKEINSVGNSFDK